MYLRRLLRGSPALAMLIVAATMLARLAVPAGFMPVAGPAGVSLTVCTGSGPMRMAMPDSEHHAPGHLEAKDRCAFADLSLPVIGPADAFQPRPGPSVVAMVRPIATASLDIVDFPRLRPPLRGPPILG